MTIGLNFAFISGNVGEVTFSTTGSNVPCCSFFIASERQGYDAVWVRVNVYGKNTNICKDKLAKGVYVIVKGEMMNRTSGGKNEKFLTEVRCHEIVFP